METPQILLVEDDPAITAPLTAFLESEGFAVTAVPGQRAAEDLLSKQVFDLLLVDLLLADGSGYGVCAAAKEWGFPVIFLTASGDEGSVVAGLDMGADDYVAKPFRPRELSSRMRSVLRRRGRQTEVCLGPVRIDTEAGEVRKHGAPLALSALEYRLLVYFANHRGQLLTRSQLLEEIWDVAGDFVNDNTLTVYIKRLREKIEDDPQNPAIIKTVRGLGYTVAK